MRHSPLRFEPVFKERVWGGRRLARFFPQLPAGVIGEAGLLSGHPEGRTPIAKGPRPGACLPPVCPLLIKLLDAADDLSMQVHPRDGDLELMPGEAGKTEMWVILDAEPGAQVIYGLKPGVDREGFRAAVAAGRVMETLRTVAVKPGDVLYIPAGTVHALGRGLLVAEIQQSSDTTYRIYDYDRPGLDGKPRPLHVEQALRSIHFGAPPQIGHMTEGAANEWEQLCRSPYFTVAHGSCIGEWAQPNTSGAGVIILVLAGSGALSREGGREPVGPGATLLLPAGMAGCRLTGELRALRVELPPAGGRPVWLEPVAAGEAAG